MGIDPLLIKANVDALQEEERDLRTKLADLAPDLELASAAAFTDLIRHVPQVRDAVTNGAPEHIRTVFVRTIRAVGARPPTAPRTHGCPRRR